MCKQKLVNVVHIISDIVKSKTNGTNRTNILRTFYPIYFTANNLTNWDLVNEWSIDLSIDTNLQMRAMKNSTVSNGPMGAAQGATLWITQISVHIS